MGIFEVGEFAEVIETGRIGCINDINENMLEIQFCDKSLVNPEVVSYEESELKPVNVNKVKKSQLKFLVRGELSLFELSGGTNYLDEYIEEDVEECSVTIDDFFEGFKIFKDKTPDEIMGWIDPIIQFRDNIDDFDDYCDEKTFNVEEETKQYIIDDLYDLYDSLSYGYGNEGYDEGISSWISETYEEIKKYIESGRKIVPEAVAVRLAGRFDDNDIDEQDEKIQELFKEFLDQLCDKKEAWAIRKRGYCYYCGTKVYPNDWIKARDAFIEYYDLSGDASAANTLGYIYYYGRCNDGVPQYEEAFKYFSIGHAYGYFESTYKLADMFRHGYGVKADGKTAYRMYERVYDENLKLFRKGDYECKFADAALRMGNCYKDGIGCVVNIDYAYAFYLEADLAIRERVRVADHYGDTVVYNGIQKALRDIREELSERQKSYIFEYYPGWVDLMTVGHRRCCIKIEESDDGVLNINARILRRFDEKNIKTLITIPDIDYCELREDINIKTKEGSGYSIEDGTNEMIFNNIKFDRENNNTEFYMDEKYVGTISAEEYVFSPEIKEPQNEQGEKYHFVSVVFDKQGRSYDYLCDDLSVTIGDKAVVNGYNGETEVEVVDTYDKYESEIALPINRYKKIVRKVKD